MYIPGGIVMTKNTYVLVKHFVIVLNGIEILIDECSIDTITYRWRRIKLKSFKRFANKNAKKHKNRTHHHQQMFS
jgi:hypothetical protein